MHASHSNHRDRITAAGPFAPSVLKAQARGRWKASTVRLTLLLNPRPLRSFSRTRARVGPTLSRTHNLKPQRPFGQDNRLVFTYICRSTGFLHTRKCENQSKATVVARSQTRKGTHTGMLHFNKINVHLCFDFEEFSWFGLPRNMHRTPLPAATES